MCWLKLEGICQNGKEIDLLSTGILPKKEGRCSHGWNSGAKLRVIIAKPCFATPILERSSGAKLRVTTLKSSPLWGEGGVRG